VTVNVTGTWDAVVTVTDSTGAPTGTEFNATFTLTQSDTDVTGTFTAEGGVRGELIRSDLLSNRTFSFEIVQDQPCPGSINGSANVLTSDTDLMHGSYSSVDCSGRLRTTFVMTRR
jgi:hypothetical protein